MNYVVMYAQLFVGGKPDGGRKAVPMQFSDDGATPMEPLEFYPTREGFPEVHLFDATGRRVLRMIAGVFYLCNPEPIDLTEWYH